MNEKLLVATLKAMIENNYEVSKNKLTSGTIREKALSEYMTLCSVLQLVIDPKALDETAEIYGVEVD